MLKSYHYSDRKTAKSNTDAAGKANELAPIAEHDQAAESENSSTYVYYTYS